MNLADIEQGPNDMRSVVVSAAGVVCFERFCHFLTRRHSLECGQGRQDLNMSEPKPVSRSLFHD
jgi:hypothetical protein